MAAGSRCGGVCRSKLRPPPPSGGALLAVGPYLHAAAPPPLQGCHPPGGVARTRGGGECAQPPCAPPARRRRFRRTRASAAARARPAPRSTARPPGQSTVPHRPRDASAARNTEPRGSGTGPRSAPGHTPPPAALRRAPSAADRARPGPRPGPARGHDTNSTTKMASSPAAAGTPSLQSHEAPSHLGEWARSAAVIRTGS